MDTYKVLQAAYRRKYELLQSRKIANIPSADEHLQLLESYLYVCD